MPNKLEEVNEQYIREYIPAIVIVTFIIIVGLTGNNAAVIYYGWKAEKSVVQFLVFSLTLNDALTNVVLMDDVVVFFNFVTYRNVVFCKLLFVLRHWFVSNSLLLMISIATDRFRRVCLMFSKQFTITSIRYVVAGQVYFSLLLSLRLCVTTDVVRITIKMEANDTKGFYCTYSENSNFKYVESIFHWVDILLHAIITVCLIVFYSLVIGKIVQSRRNLRSHRNNNVIVYQQNCMNLQPSYNNLSTEVVELQSNFTDVGGNNGSPLMNFRFPGKNSNQRTEETKKIATSTSTSNLMSETNTGSSKPVKEPNVTNKNKRLGSETKITIMVIVITLASFVCFVPYFLSILLVSSNFSGDGLIMSVEHIVFRRSYMLNSALNPIIMMVFNETFRSFVKRIPRCNCM